MLSVALSVILAFSGCSKTPSPPDDGLLPPPPPIVFDTEESVAQTWLVPGDRPRGADAVWQEINTLLQDKWNASITLRYVPWSVWQTQGATLLAADNAPDAMYVARWANYGNLASQNVLLPVDMDMLSRLAPDITQAITNWNSAGLRDCEVAGVSYMVPAAGNLRVFDLPVLIRGDLRTEHGLSPIRSVDELDALLKAFASVDTGTVIPWNADPSSLIAYLTLAWFAPHEMMLPFPDFPFLACSLTEEVPLIRNVLEEADFVDVLLRLRALSLSGALSRQAIQTRISAEQFWRAGQSAVLIGSLETVSAAYAETLRTHPEWEPEWVVFNTDGRRAREPMNQHGMAMPVNAPTPERTLLLLNELFANKTLQDLSTAGIAGLHRMAGSVYQPADMALAYPYDGTGVWGWSNLSLMLPPGEGEWLEQEVSEQWLKNPDQLISPHQAAFFFDPSPVGPQLSAMGNVLGSQAGNLLGGGTDTITDELARLNDAFNAAGMEKVQLEMQRQLDAFLK